MPEVVPPPEPGPPFSPHTTPRFASAIPEGAAAALARHFL